MESSEWPLCLKLVRIQVLVSTLMVYQLAERQVKKWDSKSHDIIPGTSSSTCYITLAYHPGRTSKYSRKSNPIWANSCDKTECFGWNFLDFFLTSLFPFNLLKTQRKKNPLFYINFQILQVSRFFSKLNDLTSSSISIYSSLLLLLLVYFQ